MALPAGKPLVYQTAFYCYGLFSWFLYLVISICNRSFFDKQSEQTQLQQAIGEYPVLLYLRRKSETDCPTLARDRFWSLSKSPFTGFHHRFHTLRNGFKLHYLTNHVNGRGSSLARANLAIFIHGYPDSCMMWRYLLEAEQGRTDLQKATLVCVDLPGFGGSDSFPCHGADEVLDAVAEFVIAMREVYLEDEDEGLQQFEGKTYIVGHDWGCIVAMRLAAEASSLADRYILVNGPHVELALANKNRILDSSAKIYKQFRHSPIHNRACLSKALHALRPLMFQALLFGYIAAFHLPPFMVKYLCTGGNLAFYRGSNRIAHRNHEQDYNMQESLAATLGPGMLECKTVTASAPSESYGKTVATRATSPGNVGMSQTSYYRDGLAVDHWTKSLEIIADLHSIELNNSNGSPFRRRSSSASSSLFVEHYKGSLHAPVTILWGQQDQACYQPICLDGIGDYLARDSEVVLLPRTGHWPPVEREGRAALRAVLKYFVVEDRVVGSVAEALNEVYPGVKLMVKK